MVLAASVTTANNNLIGSPDDTYLSMSKHPALCGCVSAREYGREQMTLADKTINSHNFRKTLARPKISHGMCITTVSVGCSFTLRTKSDLTSVVINFIAGGAIKLGGTKIVGSDTFDPIAAIANANDNSINVTIALNGLANDNFGDEVSFEAIYGANSI